MTLKSKLLLILCNIILCVICFLISWQLFGFEFVCSSKYVVTLFIGGTYGIIYSFISDYLKLKVEYKQWLKDLKNERT